MLRELNQSACSAPKSHPRKFLTLEKVLPREQGLYLFFNFFTLLNNVNFTTINGLVQNAKFLNQTTEKHHNIRRRGRKKK